MTASMCSIFLWGVLGVKNARKHQKIIKTFRSFIKHSRPPLEPKGVLKGLRNSGKEIQEKTVFHDFSLFSGVFDPQDPHRKIELINAHLSVGVSTLQLLECAKTSRLKFQDETRMKRAVCRMKLGCFILFILVPGLHCELALHWLKRSSFQRTLKRSSCEEEPLLNSVDRVPG